MNRRMRESERPDVMDEASLTGRGWHAEKEEAGVHAIVLALGEDSAVRALQLAGTIWTRLEHPCWMMWREQEAGQ